jgi:hypothetical protein
MILVEILIRYNPDPPRFNSLCANGLIFKDSILCTYWFTVIILGIL